MHGLAEARSGYLAAFERAKKTREPRWLGDARRAAISRFAEIGFPGPKNEDWKYTGTTPLLASPFHSALGTEQLAYDRDHVERRIAAYAWSSSMACSMRRYPVKSPLAEVCSHVISPRIW
jgi:hypothetical protein